MMLPLRKLLDKRAVGRLVDEFVGRTPGIRRCAIVGEDGDSFVASPAGAMPAGSRRILESPLVLNGDRWATIRADLDESAPADCGDRLRLLAAAVGELAALGIEKKDIVLDALDKYREITLLYWIGETIASSLDVEQISRLVLETNRRVIKAADSTILFVRPESGELEVGATSGSGRGADARAVIAASVVATGKPEIVNDTRSDARFMPHAGEVRSLVGVPLKHKDEILGAIAVSNKLSGEMFTARDEKLLMTLAAETAVAVDNARLVGELKTKNRELEAALARVELLQKITNHLGKFVPQSVKRTIQENPEAPELEKQTKDVSILFLDIAGYTRISESLDQEKVGYLVERYFSSFLDDIHRNDGDINETAGDGLMIIFQSPDPCRHAMQAARTALAIRDKTRQINADLEGAYAPVVVNIGINSGTASVGSTKFEGITGTRWTYTASGPVTNVAARISAFARDGAVLVSGATASRLSTAFDLEDLGAQRFKNVGSPIAVFRLKGQLSSGDGSG